METDETKAFAETDDDFNYGYNFEFNDKTIRAGESACFFSFFKHFFYLHLFFMFFQMLSLFFIIV